MLPDETGQFRLVGGAPDEAAVQTGVGSISYLGPPAQREGEQAQAIGMKLDRATVSRVSDLPFRHAFTLALEAFGHGVLLLMAEKWGIGR